MTRHGGKPTAIALGRTLAASLLGLALSACESDQPRQPAPSELDYQVRDISEQAGLGHTTRAWSATVADFNGDGRQDFLLVAHQPDPEGLYLNQGGHFQRQDLGTTADRHACAAADVDRDGRMDAYCTVGAKRGGGKADNNLYLQTADGDFTDRARDYQVADPYGRGRWTTFLNVNGDDYPDLFVGNSEGREDEHASVNRLFINIEGKTFRAGTDLGLPSDKGSHCLTRSDINGNGRDELLFCNGNRLHLYANDGKGKYFDASDRITHQRRWNEAAFADIDGDKLPDLLLIREDRFVLFPQREGRFDAPSHQVSLETGRSLAVGDADGDGDQDIYLLQSGCLQPGKMKPRRIPGQQDWLLVNHGAQGFTEIAVPRPPAGCGDRVLAIDQDGDGDQAFLTLNGAGKSPGPLRLLELTTGTGS